MIFGPTFFFTDEALYGLNKYQILDNKLIGEQFSIVFEFFVEGLGDQAKPIKLIHSCRVVLDRSMTDLPH